MKHNIIEAKDLPENEKVYLKKDSMGYRIVHPIKNPDGSINWFNFIFGGKRGLLNLVLIAILFTLLFFGFQQVTSECSELAANPCNYCAGYAENNFETPDSWNQFRLNPGDFSFEAVIEDAETER